MVKLSSKDAFDNTQLLFAIKDGGDYKLVTELTFTPGNYSSKQTVYLIGNDDALDEGFHKAVLTTEANGGGYVNVLNSVVVDVADNEVPGVLVLESDASTDVVEDTDGNFDDVAPLDDQPSGFNPANFSPDDTYRVLLTKAPESGETVKVLLSADATRTQRGAGLLGIRAFVPEVTLSASELMFGESDWFEPQQVLVEAAEDGKVDGGDSKSFATQLDQANSIEGPLVITGGLSEDRSADLEREPVMLPAETNFKKSIGTVQSTPVGVDPSFTLTINLLEMTDGETLVDTEVEGGTDGVTTITTLVNGNEPDLPAVSEVQILTIDAVSGDFKLTLDGFGTTGAITYDPDNPGPQTMAGTVAEQIASELTTLAGVPVDVEALGAETFKVTFSDATDYEALEVDTSGLASPLTRVGTAVDSSDTQHQILTINGNAGSFTLKLGVNTTATINFRPDDPEFDQAGEIETKLNNILVGYTASVSGSGTTYVVDFDSDPGTALSFPPGDEELRIDELVTLRIDASSGSFKLKVGSATTDPISYNTDPNALAGAIETALEALMNIDGMSTDLNDVRVTPDDVLDAFFTIQFEDPGGFAIDGVEVVDSTLRRTVAEAIRTAVDLTGPIATADDLKGFTLEITRNDAKNKIRLINGGDDTGPTLTLDVSRPWEAGLTDAVPSATPPASEFTVEKTNPNLLVDEREETDFFFLNDTDNVTNIDELPTAQLIVTADRLTGLGMADTQLIGQGPSAREIEGGIEYKGLEELIINLGSGDNEIIIEDTDVGATKINAGDGDDIFFVNKISGHTYLNASAGFDTFNVDDSININGLTNRADASGSGEVAGINALLTVMGDVPQAVALTLGKGSPFEPVSGTAAANEEQQITVDATGGEFQVGFIVDGVRYFNDPSTDPLAYDVAPETLEAVIQGLVESAFGATGGTADIEVIRGGNVYRIKYMDEMGGRDVPLIEINDLGLTMERIDGGDVLNIDNSAAEDGQVAVLTATSLTGLGMGDFGDDSTRFNEIQTIRLDADGGTFRLRLEGDGFDGIETPDLPFNVPAAGLQTALEDLLEEAYGFIDSSDGKPKNNVRVTVADDVYVLEFRGLLSNFDVAQVIVADNSLTKIVEEAAVLARRRTTPCRSQAISRPLPASTASPLPRRTRSRRSISRRDGGTFRLRFPATTAMR